MPQLERARVGAEEAQTEHRHHDDGNLRPNVKMVSQHIPRYRATSPEVLICRLLKEATSRQCSTQDCIAGSRS